MRVLVDRLSQRQAAGEVTAAELVTLYAAPASDWLRVNMVSTVDGAATGEDGLTGSVNNPADTLVFHTLRRLADGILVGAGTARAEGYRPTDRPTVVVSRRGDVPDGLRGRCDGSVLLVTCGAAPGLGEAREALGGEQVLVLGEHSVDLGSLRAALVERGMRTLLSEGGPHLLRDLLAAGAVDELCATTVPRLVAGAGPRIAAGPALDVTLDLRLLLEQDGTLLGRWFVQPRHRVSRAAPSTTT
jgi:riboflavin biosynthesis pyrimidine reductase